MKKIYKILFSIFLFSVSTDVYSQEENFESWFNSFKKYALKNGISEKTFNFSHWTHDSNSFVFVC